MKNSIRFRTMVGILVSVLIIILVMMLVIINVVSDHQKQLAHDSVEQKAMYYAENFNNLMSRKLELSKSLAEMLEVNSTRSRQEVMKIFENVLAKDDEIIDAFLVIEPNGFDGNDAAFRNAPGHDSTGTFNFNYNRYSGSITVDPGIDSYNSEYYNVPKNTLKPLITEPYLYDGVLLSTFSVPIIRNGRFIGVAGIDLALNDIDKMVSRVKVFETGYAFVLSRTGIFVAAKDKGMIGSKNFFETIGKDIEFSHMKSDIEAGSKGFVEEKNDEYLKKEVDIYYAPVKAANWAFALAVPLDEKYAGITKLKFILGFIGLFAVVLMGVISNIIAKRIAEPIIQLTKSADKVASGDLDVNVDIKAEGEIHMLTESFRKILKTQKEKQSAVEKIASGTLEIVSLASEKDALGISLNKEIDTIGKLMNEVTVLISHARNGNLNARADADSFTGGWNELIAGINSLLNEVVTPIKEGSAVLAEMAGGDLTVRMKGDYKGDYKLIRDSIALLGDSLNSTLMDVSDGIQTTNSASAEISSSTEQMAGGASQQSLQITEIASAIEEMTKTILESSQNAGTASDSSVQASDTARQGTSQAEITKQGMMRIVRATGLTGSKITSLAKKTDQIGEIAQVIDDIADQTNLLALNAAIEAARAGDQGRGFAVVADEVRKLAERTTTATREIAETIKSIQIEARDADGSMAEAKTAVEEGMRLTEQVESSFRKILEMNQQVSDIIAQVATAAEEQSATAEQISKNVENISNVTQESAAGVQQIAKAAEDLNRLTVGLNAQIGKFRLTETKRLLA